MPRRPDLFRLSASLRLGGSLPVRVRFGEFSRKGAEALSRDRTPALSPRRAGFASLRLRHGASKTLRCSSPYSPAPHLHHEVHEDGHKKLSGTHAPERRQELRRNDPASDPTASVSPGFASPRPATARRGLCVAFSGIPDPQFPAWRLGGSSRLPGLSGFRPSIPPPSGSRLPGKCRGRVVRRTAQFCRAKTVSGKPFPRVNPHKTSALPTRF